jgi:hypothetical protein
MKDVNMDLAYSKHERYEKLIKIYVRETCREKMA